ncbi:hypothetical protein HGM15179_018194, partial [Zosterops borbonicus]
RSGALMDPGTNSALAEWEPQIRKLPEEFESDAELEQLTAALEERDTRISKLTSDLGDSNAKLKERDRKITKLASEIRRLTALL